MFALALLPGFMGNIGTWFARYIQISFWVPMAALVDFVNFKTKDIVVNMYCNADLSQQLWFPVIQLTLLDIVTLICLLAVPSMCLGGVKLGCKRGERSNYACCYEGIYDEEIIVKRILIWERLN